MLSPTEMLLVLAGVIILVGGKKLPELGSGLGKGISEFKKAISADKTEDESKQIKEAEAKVEEKKPSP